MAKDLIQRQLDRSKRRFLLGLGIDGLLALLLLVWGCYFFAHFPFPGARVLAGLTLLLGSLVGIYRLGQRWRLWQKKGGAAGSLERAVPALRSNLTTVEEWRRGRSANNPYGFSSALLQRAVNEVRLVFENLPFERFASRRRVVALGLFICLTAMVRPERALYGLLLHDALVEGRSESWQMAAPLAVGNVRVSYRYPPHTGLPAISDQGVAGTIRAPFGTELSIEFDTDREMTRVGLELLHEGFVPAEKGSGRHYVVRFSLRESGAGYFIGQDLAHQARRDPQGLSLDAEEDRAPEIKILEPSREMETDRNATVRFVYEASDDYGLSSVDLMAEGEGGWQRRLRLSPPKGTSMKDEMSLRLDQLPIRQSDRSLAVRIEARDNDGVSGSKEGKSETVTIRFPDVEELRRQRIESYAGWLDAVLQVLADDLEVFQPNRPDPLPTDWLKKWEGGWKRLQELRREIPPREASGETRAYVRRKIAADLDALMVAKEELLTKMTSPSWTEAAKRFASELGVEIGRLEKLAIWLDREATDERTRSMTDRSHDLADIADEISRSLESAEGTKGEAMKRYVEQLRSALDGLLRSMAALAHKGSPEFINPEAFEGKDLGSLARELAEIDRLLREGKLEEARRRLREYSERIREMTRRLQEEGGVKSAEMNQKLTREFSRTRAQLSKIKEDQRRLLDETLRWEREKNERFFRERADRLRDLIERSKRLEATLRRGTEEAAAATPALPRARDSARRLRSQLEQKALPAASSEARRLRDDLTTLQSQGTPRGFDAVKSGAQQAGEIAELLEQMLRQLSEGSKAGNLARKEKEVGERMSDLQRRMNRLRQEFGLFGAPSMEHARGAREKMESAEQSLQQGQGARAGVEERDALADLERLEQEVDSAEGETRLTPSGARPHGQSAMGGVSSEPVLIPEGERREEFENWHRAIMDALKETPPEGNEEPTRKYFRGIRP